MRLTEEQYENSLMHYGILRKSGRYPWGSGANPNQRSRSFLDIIEIHKKQGLSEKQIAELYSTKEYPMTSTNIKAMKARAVNMRNQERLAQVNRLAEKGMSNTKIGEAMGLNESTVRSLRAEGRQARTDMLPATAEMLRQQVAEKTLVDVGSQVQRDLTIDGVQGIAISKDKFDTAISMLQEEGYSVVTVRVPQAGTGEFTKRRVLIPPGMTQKEAFLRRDEIKLLGKQTKDGGRTWDKDLELVPPLSIDLKRVGINYKEDGGADADGVIYVRPGVHDVRLGNSQYAQVRIAVGGTHYLKGMAVYKNDLPKGVDLVFNTNKSNTGNKLDALKKMKVDKDGNIDEKNPFGAAIKLGGQMKGKDGKADSAMNLINEEGDWSKWSKNLSSQFLSKQQPELAQKQLAETFRRRREELDKILRLTNPTVKKRLLESFAEDTDSSAVHLKAAAMPKQATKVLLPIPSMKPTEVYAPTFKDGTRVALVRYPHAGRFEIPELTVNNRNREAREIIGTSGTNGKSHDAIGIHPKVASKLSGADFDGDSVVVIPNNRREVKSAPSLDRLKNFDPQGEYRAYDGMRTIDGGVYNAKTRSVDYGKDANGNPRKPKTTPKQTEMGKVTNLISDMTIRGANDDEIARAVRHSMVVIDAEKHSLDYKRSERDHGILQLKRKYQGRIDENGRLRTGASTLVTRATSEMPVANRKAPTKKDLEGRPDAEFIKRGIDIRTGKRVYVPTGETRVSFPGPGGKKFSRDFRSREEAEAFVRDEQPNGTVTTKTFKSKMLAETDDAWTLVSDQGPRGTRIEQLYAAHSNSLKTLANEARREYVQTPSLKYDPSAKATYAAEVKQLEAKLDTALKNAPYERQAQTIADHIIGQAQRANPGMDKAEKRKVRTLALNEARIRTGAQKDRIEITPREWDAIQAGAISDSKLRQILSNTDVDRIRELATPRESTVMTTVMTAKAKALLAGGSTPAEVAERLGIPVSTLQSSLGGE